MFRLKTLLEHSGWKVLKAFAVGWLVVMIPQWSDLIVLPEPWDKVLSDIAGFAAGALRLLFLDKSDPTVSAKAMPEDVVAMLPEKDQAKVEKAIEPTP